MSSRLSRFLLSPQGVEGNTPNPDAEAQPKGQDKNSGIDALKAKYDGDLNRVIDKLYDDAFRAREAKREAEAKVPQAGSRVLSAEEAKAFDTFQSLGPLDEVKRKVRDYPDLDGKVKGFERRDHLSEIAGKAAIDGKPVNPKVLATLAGDLEFVVKDGTGKDAPDVLVKHKDADGKDVETPFAKYAAKEWAEFLPSLAPGTATGDRPRGTPRHDDRTIEREEAPTRSQTTPEGQLRRSPRYAKLG